ncbi:MAG: YdcF family protein [Clostridia bacterium]|nr:YdcF family protein [Clostridia bacterium]
MHSAKIGILGGDLVKKAVRILLIITACCLCAIMLCGIAALMINAHVKSVTAPRILSPEQAAELEDVDCILVLGCLVRSDGSPSDMLEDRLLQGITLYKNGTSPKLLMSGDHGQTDYDEVNTMKTRAIEEGVPSEDVFMDHAGFSTYESVYRAKEIFGAKKIVIVTQEYHLYRALYVAQALGIEAYGVSADLRSYAGQTKRDVREVLARLKDTVYALFQPEPTYLGEPIDLSGSGDVTNDT